MGISQMEVRGHYTVEKHTGGPGLSIKDGEPEVTEERLMDPDEMYGKS